MLQRNFVPDLSHGHQQARPAPGLAVAAKDAVPVTEAGWQVPPGDARVHQVHDPVQEAVEVDGKAGADFGVLAQRLYRAWNSTLRSVWQDMMESP